MNSRNNLLFAIFIGVISISLSLFVIWLMRGINFFAYFILAGFLFMVMVLLKRRKLDVFEPIFLFTLMALLSYYVRAYGLHKGNIDFYLSHFKSWASPVGYSKAMAVVILAFFSLCLGYSVPVKFEPELPKGESKIAISMPHLAVLIPSIFVFSVFCLYAVVKLIEEPIWVAIGHRLEAFKGLGYLALGAEASTIACVTSIILSWIFKFRLPKKVYVLLLFSFLLILFLGSRAPVVNLLLILIGSWYYFQPGRYKLIKLALSGIFLILLLNVYADMRGTGRIDLKLVFLNSKNLAKQGIVLDLGRRTPEFDALTLILDDRPHLPLQYGKTYLSILTAPIPSKIFPGKLESGGTLFNNHFLPEIYKEGRKAGIRPSILGELYMNFGYLGIIAGMFLLGVIMKFMYHWFIRVGPYARHSPEKVIFYLILIAHIPQLVRGEFCGTMISIFYISFVSLLTLAIVKKRNG